MAKTEYSCSGCGTTHPRWLGRCPRCGEFGTIAEAAPSGPAPAGIKGDLTAGTVTRPARRVRDVQTSNVQHSPTRIGEFDRVLGGGLVAGQVVLLAGEPGVGKSTLLLAVSHQVAEAGSTVLYISGEESAEQIALRARRTGANSDSLLIADETDLSRILAHIEQSSPDMVIVDSVQTVASPHVDGRAGGMAQVQEVATVLTRIAKSRQLSLLLVGQITKSSDLAGPKTLEHLVDTVLFFEGDRNSGLRLLRTIKNRFGPADEIACFEQTETGIAEVPDPSGLFATGRDEPAPGVAITVAMEGRRPLLVEMQALVSPTNSPNPRRGVAGLDTARAAMLVAVTERHGRARMFDKDTFLATIAGMRVVEPTADLAVCAALYTAAKELPVPLDLAFLGEVALSGDVRRVTNPRQRITEAVRLGHKRIVVPHGTPKVDGAILLPVKNLGSLFALLDTAGNPNKPSS